MWQSCERTAHCRPCQSMFALFAHCEWHALTSHTTLHLWCLYLFCPRSCPVNICATFCLPTPSVYYYQSACRLCGRGNSIEPVLDGYCLLLLVLLQVIERVDCLQDDLIRCITLLQHILWPPHLWKEHEIKFHILYSCNHLQLELGRAGSMKLFVTPS